MTRSTIIRIPVLAALVASLGAAQTASLGLSSGSGSPGSVVTLNLMLASTSIQPSALQWTASYSPQDISSVSVAPGSGTTASIQCNNTPGASSCVVWAINSNTIQDGVVATLALTLAGSTTDTSSAIQLFNGDGASLDGMAIPTGTTGGTVTLAPAPPVIGGAGSASGIVGSPFSYQIAATNSPTGYGANGLPGGLSVNASSGLISGTPSAAGISQVTLSATNAGGTANATLMLTVTAASPVITSANTAGGTVGNAFSYQVAATNSPTGYAAAGLPAGLAINTTTGLISGTPTAAGSSTVALSALNSGGTGNATLTLNVAAATPPAPAITSAVSINGTVGSAFSYQIVATNSPTGYGASGLPAGLAVNASTGLISGTPSAAGSSTVALSATNSGGTGNATLTVAIAAVTPPAPVITSGASVNGIVGSAFSYQIAATNSPTSYAAAGLPAGLAINTTTGAISGIPTAAGSSTVALSATNGGGIGSATLTVTIAPATPPAPVITSAASDSGTVGSAFSYQIAATNSPSKFGATGLPAGLSINSTGLISGKPKAAGTSTVVVSATNSGGTGHLTVTLTVAPAVAKPVIDSAPSASGIDGVAFSYQIAATNSPTSFGVSWLPAGLSLNTTTGLISGTPANSGTWMVTLKATNSAGTERASLMLSIQRTGNGNLNQ